MKFVKKTFNLSREISDKIDAAIMSTPGMSFALLSTFAFESWLNHPEIGVSGVRQVSAESVSAIIDEHKLLLEELSK
jgi:hypothetical protein